MSKLKFNLGSTLKSALAPQERESPVAWAEKNLYLSERVSPNCPGNYSTALTPYVREVLECAGSKRVRDIILCWGAQTGKTRTLMTALSYKIDQDPVAALWVMSSADMARSLSQDKFLPMCRENPALQKHMPENADDFKSLEQRFDRMTLNWVGANSPGNLAARPVGLLFCDEVDKYPPSTRGEAGALALAYERTKSFPLAQRFVTSTPTSEHGQIWSLFESGDQRYFFVPSPFTGKFFKFEFSRENLKWDPEARDDAGVWNADQVRRSAYYVCPFSGEKILDKHKQKMLLAGEWRPTNSNAETGTRSYHLNSFYSPWVTFGQMAGEFLKQQNLFGLQNYYNSWLALPWRDSSVTVETEDVLALRSGYVRGECPFEPKHILVGADVGMTYVRWVAVAFAEDGAMAVVNWGSEIGLTQFASAARLLRVKCPAGERGVDLAFCDAKYRREEVHPTCFKSDGFIWPTAGAGGSYGRGAVSFGTVAPYPRSYGLLTYNDRDFKNLLYNELIKGKKSPGLLLPAVVESQFIEEITRERLHENKNAHQSRRFEWKRTGDNHYGDCIKIALVANYWLAQREE